MNNDKKIKLLTYGRVWWIYTKYQLLTKTLLFLMIFPLFKIALKYLILSTGRSSISSGDYLGFLFSLQGVSFLILLLGVLTLLIGLDINAFIIMSALIKENKIVLTARHLLVVSIRSLKLLFKPSGLLIMLYIAIIVPLVGVGLSISVMSNFRIPNFIMDVILSDNLYFSIYASLILLLTITTLVYIFFFHYLLIDNQSIGSSLKKSFILMKKHWKEFLKDFFIKLGLFYVFCMSAVLLGIFLFYVFESFSDVLLRRFFTIFTVLNTAELFWYLGIMALPVLCYRLTDLFYRFNEKDGNSIHIKININAESYAVNKPEKLKFRTKFSLGIFFITLIVMNLLLSLVFTFYFDEVFKPKRNIEIVAHRAGGNLAAENSILGMNESIKFGVKWSEIDVQRTKDGHYVINHDSTFSRVAGVNKRVNQLTLDEIKKIEIKNLFNSNKPSQPVPTIEEFLQSAKGKIGLFIELKGETADEKMADEVIKMVKDRGMEKDIAILSLDYKLISYVEDKYPEINTGYLYFFSMGDIRKIKADFLIMEEEEATPEKIEALHGAGKKAIVWTINTDESVEKFVSSDVDGIITDYVKKVKDGIEARDNRSDMQVIVDSIMK